MGRDLLEEFVENGWLDGSVTEGFDPYYEPSWFAEPDFTTPWELQEELQEVGSCW